MSYAQALAELTGATAALVAAGPPAGRDLAGADADRALYARDVLVGELRALTGELLNVQDDPVQPPQPGQVSTDPARMLHEALAGLGRAAPDVGPLSDALRGSTGPWADAARAAAQLEGHHAAAARLPDPARSAALRDVAEIAAAVPILDSDLAGRLLAHDDATAMLTDAVSHGRVRISTDALRQRLPVPDGGYLTALDREPTRGMILRSPADLPAGMRRLAAIVTDIGAELNAVDARAAVRVLAAGAAALQKRPVGPAAAHPDIKEGLAAALPALRRALVEPLTTVSAPDLRLRLLTGELYRHTGALADPKTPPAVVAGWAAQAPAVGTALSTAADAAGTSGRLLTSRDKDGAIAATGWRAVVPDAAKAHPTAEALRDVHRVLDQAAPAIAAVAASTGALQSRDRALAAAAASAGRAGAQLRTALAGRSAQPRSAALDPAPRPNQRRPIAPDPPRTSRG